MPIKNELEIILKITDHKGLMLNRTYILFGKPRCAVGIWNTSIVFATMEPQTIRDAQVLIYTLDELKQLTYDGDLKGLVELND